MKEYIKELAPRLPYEVKVFVKEYSPSNWLKFRRSFVRTLSANDLYLKDEHKPIYRPLSDLTKEITHKGERKVLLNQLLDSEIIKFYLKDGGGFDCKMLRYGDIEMLLQHHFDINGWIEQGKAIDVNTLENNPYQ